VDGDTVLVADGTYTGDGNRDIDFLGKAIVVMSENGPEVTIIDCEGDSLDPHRGFYFHNEEGSGSVVWGFTIINGYSPIYIGGGGMYIGFFSSPTVSNCTFSGNSTGGYGGGMRNYYFSNPTIRDCTFIGNSSEAGGGGMYNYHYSNPTVTNCTFTGNSAYIYGGGMNNIYYSHPTVTNCTFTGNSTDWWSGGMYNWDSNPTVIHCTFSGNSASYGGGMYNWRSDPTTINSILWTNTGGTIDNDECWPSVNYSNVEGGYFGVGNIDTDPLFVDPENYDYHLLDESPCVDSGTDAGVYDDFEGDIRPLGYGFDMGADESPYSVKYNLSVTPDDSVTVPQGGTLYFSSLVQNNTESQITGDYWLSVILPDSNELIVPERILNNANPLSGEVPANDFINLDSELLVPTQADTGSYQLIGRIGNYPDGIVDEESFGFRVVE
jgi:hypothetical protein